MWFLSSQKTFAMLFSYLTSNFHIRSLYLIVFAVFQKEFVLEVAKVKNMRNLSLTRKLLEKHELKVFIPYFCSCFVPFVPIIGITIFFEPLISLWVYFILVTLGQFLLFKGDKFYKSEYFLRITFRWLILLMISTHQNQCYSYLKYTVWKNMFCYCFIIWNVLIDSGKSWYLKHGQVLFRKKRLSFLKFCTFFLTDIFHDKVEPISRANKRTNAIILVE